MQWQKKNKLVLHVQVWGLLEQCWWDWLKCNQDEYPLPFRCSYFSNVKALLFETVGALRQNPPTKRKKTKRCDVLKPNDWQVKLLSPKTQWNHRAYLIMHLFHTYQSSSNVQTCQVTCTWKSRHNQCLRPITSDCDNSVGCWLTS